MKETEWLEWLKSPTAGALLQKMYGTEGAEAGRKRYALLMEDFIKNSLFPAPKGDLRLFSAPGRTELGGNHTDHNAGRVLAAAIQLDSAAVVAPRADGRIFFRSTGYSDVVVDLFGKDGKPDFTPREAEKGTTEALIRGIAAEFAQRGAVVQGFSVNADSTVFPGSGLSSSAAVEALFGRIINNLYHGGKCSPVEIAQIGQKAENRYFGKPCGLMDQLACSCGGAVAIDFADPDKPLVQKIDVDFTSLGLSLCVVNTGGSHADLTADYAAIPAEMKAVAALFDKSTLRDCDRGAIEKAAAKIRQKLGDRALLRAFHFFDENDRAAQMLAALEKLAAPENSAQNPSVRQEAMTNYLRLVNESGASSWELLQNVFSPQYTANQGIATALAITRNFLRDAAGGANCGAYRVHGGGFAGTMQAYIPTALLQNYCTAMDGVFGAGCVTALRIRAMGAEEVGEFAPI
jgi:galactokinase